MSDNITQLFPEWTLAWSLRETCCADGSRFWTEAKFHPTEAPTDVVSFASIFPKVRAPSGLLNERPFPKDGATKYGVEAKRYETTFWGLRPDFVAETEDSSLLLLIEAKGGRVPDGTWHDPKELSYFRFLNECSAPLHKAFSYLVPADHEQACLRCLKQYFPNSATVRTGFLLWEELLPLIYERLMETSLDQIIKQMKGLQCLREWRGRTA